MIPKKARDKIRNRLRVAKELLGDRERVADMLGRVFGEKIDPKRKSDFRDLVTQIWILFDKDVPALLDELDKLAQQPKEKA